MIQNKELENLKTPKIIENKIYYIRGQKVMIDADLAQLYEVSTGNLNLAVQRNRERFPEDFMFQLSTKEYESLILQIARSKKGRGGRRHPPYVFTEHGIAMLSSVLNSPRAITMNIYIIRVFIKMREILAIDKNLELELLGFQMELKRQGKDIEDIVLILRNLLEEPVKSLAPIGFRP